MDGLEELRGRHTHGYVPSGLCLSCRHGWHYQKDGIRGNGPGCRGRGYGASICPDYADPSPTAQEYMAIYKRELEAIYAKGTRFEKLRRFGSAQRRREYLRDVIGLGEDDLRRIEGEVLELAGDEETLRKLRWEL